MTHANGFPVAQNPEAVARQLRDDMYFYRAEHGYSSTLVDMKVVAEIETQARENRDRQLGGTACVGVQEEVEHLAPAA